MKFKKIIKATALLSLLVISGCASLSDAGRGVKVTREEPKNCKEISDLSSGNFASKTSQSDVKNDLRNMTAIAGGNVLVLDSINSVPFGGYSGSGRAFTCTL